MPQPNEPPGESKPTLARAIPALPVGDVSASIAFYEDRLDFAVVHEDDEFAIVERDAIELHVWQAADEDWRKRDADPPVATGAESFIAGTGSCRVEVDDVGALNELLEPRGVIHPNGRLRVTEYGTEEFTVVDQDGNAIAFFEPTS